MIEEQIKRKYPVQAVLSFCVCPGLGQMVKGQFLKGLGILIGLIVGLFVAVVVWVAFSLTAGIILAIGVLALYLWNIYDAYNQVPRRK